MLLNREVILAKIETSYGVDSLPVPASDAVLVQSASWSNEGLRMIERDVLKPTLGKEQQVYAGALKSVTFDVELKGSGVAGTPPEIGVLLRMCAMSETIAVGVSVTYDVVSDSSTQESGTIYFYHEGLVHKLTGCRGTVTGNLETGNYGVLSFTFTGHSSNPTDAAAPASAVFDQTLPPALLGVNFTVGGFSAAVNAISIDMGIEVTTPAQISAVNGYGEVSITNRDVNGTIDPLMTSVAENDFIGDFTSGTKMLMDTGVIGSTAGNRYQVQMPAIYYRDITPGDRDGIRTYDIPYGAVESAGDDEITIIFT